MSRYTIVLSWSEPDGVYVADVPDLPGCAADGATYQHALANAETVITEWIETATEEGRPIPVASDRRFRTGPEGSTRR